VLRIALEYHFGGDIAFFVLLRDLVGYLLEHFPAQFVRVVVALVKLHELHTVAHGFSAVLVLEFAIVVIEHVHALEVRVANPHDHDADRQLRTLHDRVYRVVEVGDLPVRNHEQHLVVLLLVDVYLVDDPA